MTIRSTLDTWADACRAFFADKPALPHEAHPLHPCIIQGAPHYVHAPSLASEHPAYFAKLQRYAQQHGITLKADQRTEDASAEHCQRRKFFPIIFLALGLQTQVSMADDINVKLNLIQGGFSESTATKEASQGAAIPALFERLKDTIVSRRIEAVLKSHFQRTPNTPATIDEDIRNLAGYYAYYPEAVALIESIADGQWTLNFAPHTFQTNIKGSRMDIDSVDVYFDPRSGAQLKYYSKCSEKKPYCIASPADALLHELLHAQMAVNEKSTFIAQGGLNPYLYPAEHERQIIMKENTLYSAMSGRDQVPRPARNEHTGHHVLVSCVTCLE